MRSTLFLLSLALPAIGTAQGGPSRDTSGAVIVVQGEGKSSAAPDELIVQLGVETRAKTASKAGSDNADRMTAVRRAIVALGITEKEISTAFYNVRMEIMGQSMRDTIYVASNSVQVDTKKLNLVSRIIDASLQAGANNINSVQYTLADSRDAMRAALTNAVDDARLQADALAKAAGGRIGELLELNASSQRVIPYQMQAMGGVAMARMAVDTPISERDITVRASVSIRWKFIPTK
jgi:uncharacterized protein YggE